MAVAHRTYARALFDAALAEGRLEQAHEDLGDFVAAAEQVPELASLLENPEVDRVAKASVLEELLGGADELVRNFLLLLVEKGRIAGLRETAREFDSLVAAEQQRLEVELTTAVELSDAESREIVAQIEQAAGRKVEASRGVDPDLIGGLVLQIGSLRVDASVRGRLDQLRRDLRTRS
ncbi:MAG: ATP synthase F1 subunit delta [Gaiellaceae bacterium]